MNLSGFDSDDFSFGEEELDLLAAKPEELKRKRPDAAEPTFMTHPARASREVEPHMPQKKVCSSLAAPTPSTNLAPKPPALDLADFDLSDSSSDDCFILDESLDKKLLELTNSINQQRPKQVAPARQNLTMGRPFASRSNQAPLPPRPSPAPMHTSLNNVPPAKNLPEVIDCDSFFDDLDDSDDEALNLMSGQATTARNTTTNISNRSNTLSALGSNLARPSAASTSKNYNISASSENPASDLSTKQVKPAVQKTLTSFGYNSSHPTSESSSNGGTTLPSAVDTPAGVLRKGITHSGHYTPPKDCYETRHDYVPLLHCPVAVETWIYPINYPVRDYQFNIVQKALHENTLVALPTGLGKTFIAAVVMYNFYRWFPKMKVVFTAPTKPLVAQQIEACYKVCGITQKDSVELTGAQSKDSRVDSWATKRVFYLTPQVMQNDLESGLVDARDVACIVIDEAHRAQKAYAYVNVVQALYKKNPLVRVLALSATPGTSLDNVRSVVKNLNIARIEFRTEDALDLRPYTFDKEIEKIIVPPGPAIEEIAAGMKNMITPYLERLRCRGVIYSNDPDKANVFQLLEARGGFRARSGGFNSPESLAAEGDFALCISLLRMLELLIKYGFSTFYTKLVEWLAESGPNGPKYRRQLASSPMFIEILRKTETIVKAPDYHANFKSHPKIGHLFQYLKRHFELHEAEALGGGTQTKVMIFAQYREIVEEVIAVLAPLSPAVRPMAFIGQASGKSGKGLKQKEQIEVISNFKRGGYNVLVCTSIGEEGLDIGEVDLIVCYDSSNSPIRMLQRIGRTGRRRKGRVCMLLTQGKEERSFGKSKSTHKQVLSGIRQGDIQYYALNPRMLPEGVVPKCDKRIIEIPTYQTAAATKGARSRKSDVHGLTPDELDHFHEMYGTASPIFPSLTRYPVQQCHPSLTHRVRHSSRTKTFIEIMRKCDSAARSCDELLMDASDLLAPRDASSPALSAQTSLRRPTPLKAPPKRPTALKAPPKISPPPPKDDLDFLDGISLSSLSEDEAPGPPKSPSPLPPPKIQWRDIDSRIKLIFDRYAALTKRSMEVETEPLGTGSIEQAISPQNSRLDATSQVFDSSHNDPSASHIDSEEASNISIGTTTETAPLPSASHIDSEEASNISIGTTTETAPLPSALCLPLDLLSDDLSDGSSLIFDSLLDHLPAPAAREPTADQTSVWTIRQQPSQSHARVIDLESKTDTSAAQAPPLNFTFDTSSVIFDDRQPVDQEPSATQTPIRAARRRHRQGPMVLSATPSPQKRPVLKRRKLLPKAAGLMELEAEESGKEGSSEDESSSGDDADDSFVCGDGEVVRECEEEDYESKMQDIYRQSLLSQENSATGFSTRANQFGWQRPNLRYIASKKAPVVEDSQEQEDSFVVDDSDPVEMAEWTDEHESEDMDEDQANARLESILEIPDEQSASISIPDIPQTYAEAAAALNSRDPPAPPLPNIPPHWHRYSKF